MKYKLKKEKMSLKKVLLEITKQEYTTEYIKNNMEKVGQGTEGEVYSDDNFTYKIAPQDISGRAEDIKKKHVGKNYKNVVNIIDAWEDEDDIIIKMEKLEPIPNKVTNSKEWDKLHDVLWNNRRIRYIKQVKKHFNDPEIKKIIDTVINAFNELNGLPDIGVHNIMYDPKTNEYKQIDIT